MIRLDKKEKCCGCEACKQICPRKCIEFKYDEEGFMYPKINEKDCVDCGLCEKVCPIQNETPHRKPFEVLAAFNKNESVRKESSSGGIFYLLAKKTIENNGVVFGAKFNKTWGIEHDFTENVECIQPFMGSKYVQSRIGESFIKVRTFLKQGRLVLFSGTPCQVKALRLFLRKEYKNLLLVEVVCHGVPSPILWQKYIREQYYKEKNTIIEKLSFRWKVSRWETFHLYCKSSTGGKLKEKSEPFNDSLWGKAFVQNLFLRPSCYSCPIKQLSSGSDITLGDFWGIDNFHKEFNDHKGASLMMVNTEKAKSFIEDIPFNQVESKYEYAIFRNKVIEKPYEYNPKREFFYKYYIRHGQLLKAIHKYTRPSLYVKFKHDVKKFLKTIIKK